MKKFGDLLRFYRQRSVDPVREGRPLTQERLGQLIGDELNDAGYTGAAISDWERGKSHIHKDQRVVLTALIKVLVRCEGLETVTEANTMLRAGNYRSLDNEEVKSVFSAGESKMKTLYTLGSTEGGVRLTILFLGELIFRPSRAIRSLFDEAADEPPPRWPRLLLRLIAWPLDHWSSEDLLNAAAWTAVWLLAWRLTFPLLRWPYVDMGALVTAVTRFSIGVLIVPLLTGMLIRTRSDPFWQEQGLSSSLLLRLYTYQGAFIGFQIGYIMIFSLVLAGNYLGIHRAPYILGAIAAVWPVVLGFAAAKQVPFNLWRAFGSLRLSDGAVFFVFVIFGPVYALLWGLYHPLILSPVAGIPLLLLTFMLLAGLTAYQKYKTGSGVIPVHTWVALLGTIIVLRQLNTGANVVGTGGIVALMAILFFITWRFIRRR